ncbi:hypothetical protein PFLUV_G00228180 [Perca fluviatilis]|uniref:Secreted protein n=1 Tax=Perca fluviatilis TaxID=8168 RepID=A0A6A5EK39_PERFL|nr:hypothetical protein PFLUV_G00228180 [Perca fluviatilis]
MFCPAMSLTSIVMAALSCCVSVHLWTAPLFNKKPILYHFNVGTPKLERHFGGQQQLLKQLHGSLEKGFQDPAAITSASIRMSCKPASPNRLPIQDRKAIHV